MYADTVRASCATCPHRIQYFALPYHLCTVFYSISLRFLHNIYSFYSRAAVASPRKCTRGAVRSAACTYAPRSALSGLYLLIRPLLSRAFLTPLFISSSVLDRLATALPVVVIIPRLPPPYSHETSSGRNVTGLLLVPRRCARACKEAFFRRGFLAVTTFSLPPPLLAALVNLHSSFWRIDVISAPRYTRGTEPPLPFVILSFGARARAESHAGLCILRGRLLRPSVAKAESGCLSVGSIVSLVRIRSDRRAMWIFSRVTRDDRRIYRALCQRRTYDDGGRRESTFPLRTYAR